MRRNVAIFFAGGLALVAAAGLAGWLYERPTTLQIGVAGDTEEQRLIAAAAQVVAREREKVRFKVVAFDHAAASAAALDAGDVDFAVARTDIAMPKTGQTAVILYRSAAVIVAPAGSPIKRATDLKGRRIGFLQPSTGAMASLGLLEQILGHYGASPETTPRIQVAFGELREAFAEERIDAIVAVGLAGAGNVADVVNVVAAAGGGPPNFIPVTESKALAQGSPALETITVPRGAYGGGPTLPPEDYETVAVSTRLLARSSVRDSVVGDVTRVLFANRPAIAAIAPLANRMEAPATNKGSAIPVHPGAAAFLDGEEETFFEKYSDFIYIGAMLLSVMASAAAALISRFDTARRQQVEELIENLLEHLAAARNAQSSGDLDAIEHDSDRILSAALQSGASRALDSHRVSALGLALDQVRLAVRDRRNALEDAPTGFVRETPRLISGE